MGTSEAEALGPGVKLSAASAGAAIGLCGLNLILLATAAWLDRFMPRARARLAVGSATLMVGAGMVWAAWRRSPGVSGHASARAALRSRAERALGAVREP